MGRNPAVFPEPEVPAPRTRARPVRLDYLVFLWAFVPWLYRQADPFRWLHPSSWRLASLRSPGAVDRRVREFLGLQV